MKRLGLRSDGLGRCHQLLPRSDALNCPFTHPMGRLKHLQATVCLDCRTDAEEKKGSLTGLFASLKIESDTLSAHNEDEKTPAAHGLGQSRHGGRRAQLFLPPAAQGHRLRVAPRQLRCLKVMRFTKLSNLHCALKQELTLDMRGVLAKRLYHRRRRVASNLRFACPQRLRRCRRHSLPTDDLNARALSTP